MGFAKRSADDRRFTDMRRSLAVEGSGTAMTLQGLFGTMLLLWAALVLEISPTQGSAQHSITGRVFGADTGAALPRARIDILAGTQRVTSVFTDDQGRFAVDSSLRPPYQ